MTLPTVVSHLPYAWQGLLKALFVRDWPLAAAETWLRQNQDSAYGDALSWTALIKALCREEPVSCKGTLKFKPRLFCLPPSLQQHLVAIIHQHHQEICVDTLRRFVTVLQSGDDAMSTGWLRTYIGWLNWNCQRRCDADRGPRGSGAYSFSAENKGHFKALCSKLSAVERSRHTRIWRVGSCLNSESSDSNLHTTSSPAPSESPLPCSLPVVDDIETPSKAKSPTQPSHSDTDSCLSTHSDGVHKKRKLQEDGVAYDEHNGNQVGEIDSREMEIVLDSDVQVLVGKLKELWETGTEEPLPKNKLAIFTQFPTQTVIDVCRDLAKSGLSEVAIVTACKHLCGVSDQISHEKALVFASSLLLPMVLGLHGTASRSLLSAVIMFSGPFAKPLIEAVLVPCASSDKLGSQHIDLLSNVLKTFNPAQQKEFLRKFLSESWPWNESTSSFLLNILDLKIDMDGEQLSMLMSSLKRSGIEQIKGLKFAKVLLEMINKYGKQMTATHIGQLSEILQQNESFLKKSALAAIAKLQKPQS